jgi:hypothetical protein
MQMGFDLYWHRSPVLRDVVVARTESTDNLLCAAQSDNDQVRLEAVTQIGPGDLFVTASVTVRRA